MDITPSVLRIIAKEPYLYERTIAQVLDYLADALEQVPSISEEQLIRQKLEE